MGFQEPNILLVEDNDFDVKRIERGFERLGQKRHMLRARDGMEALQILRGETDTGPIGRPLAILLDLNMPRMGGLAFLDELREDEALADLPVFVISTSEFDRDIDAAHRRNVSGYIVKPRTSDEMIQVLSALSDFWSKCAFPR